MHRLKFLSESIFVPLRRTGKCPQRNLSVLGVGMNSSFKRDPHRNDCVGPVIRQSGHNTPVTLPPSTARCLLLPHRRSMSTDEEGGGERKIKPVFFAIPNPIKVIRNNIFYWLIRSYFDPDFSIDEFTQGAKQALVTISSEIAQGTLENLEGLLSPKLIREIKSICRGFSVKEMSSLPVSADDILHTFPHDIAIHYDDKGGKFLFILMKFWCHSTKAGSSDPEVKGFRVGRPPPGVSQETFDSLGSVYSCTYEFHRNISPGASPDWMITYMQHGQLINTDTRGLPEDE